MKPKLLIAILFVVGCGNYYRRPKQDLAEQIVWRMSYGETHDPPSLEWKTDGLDCYNSEGWYDSGECVGGVYYEWDDHAIVALPITEPPFSGTAYAHELLHAHLKKWLGDGDRDHCMSEWGGVQNVKCNPNPMAGLLDFTNKNLADSGL